MEISEREWFLDLFVVADVGVNILTDEEMVLYACACVVGRCGVPSLLLAVSDNPFVQLLGSQTAVRLPIERIYADLGSGEQGRDGVEAGH